ncbi:MAG: hypothetical protein V4548_12700 [Bacteroidota bacterium]
MKKIIIFIVFTIIACGKKQTATNINEYDLYKIKRIDLINNVYIIYASKPDSLFKIVSVKNEFNDCKKIEVGKSYHFLLKTAFFNKKTLPLDIGGLNFHDVTVTLEGDSIRDIFTSGNLKGLCYEKQ